MNDLYSRVNTLLTLATCVILWGGVVYLVPDQPAMHQLLALAVGAASGALFPAPKR